jgi:predicted nucleic acid-binding protein
MKLYVLDANAVIRYMNHSMDSQRVKTLFDRAKAGKNKLVISAVNWGEVLYTLAKRTGIPQAAEDLKTLGVAMETIPVGEADTEAAATLKHNFKLGYADSFAAALAMRLNGTLVTADPEFAKLGKRLKLMALARHGA